MKVEHHSWHSPRLGREMGVRVYGHWGPPMWAFSHTPGLKDALAGMGLAQIRLQPLVAVLGMGVSLFLGFVAGFVPALGAYRARITDMLRTV